MKHLIIRAMLGLASALIAAPAVAQSQQNCAPRDVVVERLSGGYGEVFSGGGLQSTDSVFEIWTSEKDGTWTILMTRSDGMSCVMAAGTDWRKALASQQVLGAPA